MREAFALKTFNFFPDLILMALFTWLALVFTYLSDGS